VDVASPAITALVEAARSTSEALGWRG
jgi:hypothetical protein